MAPSIPRLREELDDFLAELGTLHYRHGAGLTHELPLRSLYQAHPELSSPETFAQIKEAMGRTGLDPDVQRRLRMLLEFVCAQVEDAIAADAAEAVASLEGTAEVALPQGGTQRFRDAYAELPREKDRGRRGALEQALGQFLLTHQAPYARRRDAATRCAATLKADDYLSLREKVSNVALAPLVQACEGVLRATEDAYRDVLGYVLKKVDPELKPYPTGAARRHDLQRATCAPWLAEHFRREDLLPSVLRCVEELGFHPSAQGRIQLDADERPGKSGRAFVADVRVPDDVRLVVRPGHGLDDYFALLHEYGHALHFAHTSRSAPVEHRRLGDASITEAYAYLFDHFLLDERWHRRFLRLPQAVAKDAARLAAFNNLALLRRYCAKLPYEVSLYQRGPSAERSAEYEGRQTQALFVRAHPGFFLFDVDPQLYAARYLRAWALEATLHQVLCERFDEDHWRNPAAGKWLTNLFARGQRDDAELLAKELSGSALDLGKAGTRLVEILNR